MTILHQQSKHYAESIEISWDLAQFKPIHFEISFSCRLMCDSTPYQKARSFLQPSSVAFTQTGLYPGSVCEVELVALYNPASIDSGLKMVAYTLISSRLNCN